MTHSSLSHEEALQEFMRQMELDKETSLELTDVSLDEATHLAHRLALNWRFVKEPFCLLLEGQLGAGKTSFSQAFISCWLNQSQESVESPTYAYLIPYTREDGLSLFHYDLYRLKSPEEFLALGFDENWKKPALSLIEWPGCIEPLLKHKKRLTLRISYNNHLQSRHWSLHYFPSASPNKATLNKVTY